MGAWNLKWYLTSHRLTPFQGLQLSNRAFSGIVSKIKTQSSSHFLSPRLMVQRVFDASLFLITINIFRKTLKVISLYCSSSSPFKHQWLVLQKLSQFKNTLLNHRFSPSNKVRTWFLTSIHSSMTALCF